MRILRAVKHKKNLYINFNTCLSLTHMNFFSNNNVLEILKTVLEKLIPFDSIQMQLFRYFFRYFTGIFGIFRKKISVSNAIL